MERQPGIYILTNRRLGTLYTGVSGWLKERIYKHKQGIGCAFTRKHKLTQCVYYELYPTAPAAIAREKQLKGASRADKIKLIESINPKWEDLYEHFA